MFFRVSTNSLIIVIACHTLLPCAVGARPPAADRGWGGQDNLGAMTAGLDRVISLIDLDVYVKGPSGTLIEEPAVVTLTKLNGQLSVQGTTKAGYVRFTNLPATEYTLQVVALAYDRAVKKIEIAGKALVEVTIELQRVADAEDATSSLGLAALGPKAQREMGKALESLRANKPSDARSHLDVALRLAPNSAEVNYVFGVYSSQANNLAQAKSYWTKALELHPKHLSALLSLSDMLLRQNKSVEALPLLNRAVEAEPSSWRGHALLAEALLLQGSCVEAIQQAERALELGHGRAASLQRMLARALAEQGDKEQAIRVLQTYLQDHATDLAAKKQLERLRNPQTAETPSDATAAMGEITPMTAAASALPLPSSWLPPDIDEKMPPVEPGAACALDEVLRKTGKRVMEFVSNVDKFTATETLVHETINKWGFASSPEKHKFDYVVSIDQVKMGFLNVEEYRGSRASPADFPDGVATYGLPALVLIFHPDVTQSFDMTCEGLGRWNRGLAWQVHFRQRPDKPNTVRAYKVGADGPSYPVALKGRAWIAADSYQMVRLETDLIAPVPQIRLIADHTAIEYGPVHFQRRDVDMWLPQSAEVYYDWRGRRSHRRHSFSNYLLFSVEDKQRISAPEIED